jgi:hypothetical protein
MHQPRNPAGTYWYTYAFKSDSTRIAADSDPRYASAFSDVAVNR